MFKVMFVCMGFGVVMVMVMSSSRARCTAVAVVQFRNQVFLLLLFTNLKMTIN